MQGYIQINPSPLDDIANDSGVSSAWQYVNVNLPASQTYFLSGWAKGTAISDNVTKSSDPNNDQNKSFGLRAILYYADNTVEYHYAPFCPDLTEWQYTSVAIVPKDPDNTVTRICVVIAYERNANTAVFTDISLTKEVVQTMDYDENGNLMKVNTTGQASEEASYYDGSNLLATYTNGSGTWEYTYDDTYQHRPVSVTDGILTQSMGYDGMGNVTSTTLRAGDGTSLSTSAAYSQDGNRSVSVTDANGSTVQYSYSTDQSKMLGTPTTVTDARGNKTFSEYDNRGRLTKYSVENGGSVEYTYSKGNLGSMTRNDSQSYSFSYNDWGQMSKAMVGSRTLAQYSYNSTNNTLTTQTYGNGDSVSYTYDVLGRTRTAEWNSGRKLWYYYTGDSQLSGVYDSAIQDYYLYYYDDLGRLVSSEIGNITADYSYDTNSRLLNRTYRTPSTGLLYEAYTYHSNPKGSTEDGTESTAETSTLSDGALLYMQMVSGNYLNYRYDGLQRLTDKFIRLYEDGTGQQVWERYHYSGSWVSMKENWIGDTYTHKLSYTYDGNGNILTETDSENGTSVTYTYDTQNQLIQAVHRNGRTETYSYDSVGNIQSFNNGTTSHTYTYGDTNGWKDLLTAVDGQAINYDGSGNPLSYYNGYRYTFAWEQGRQLDSLTYDGRTVCYQYNHDGIRTKKTYSDGSHVVYDIVDGTAVGETHYNSAGTATMYMMYIHDENGAVNGIGLWYPGDTEWAYYYFVKNLQGDVLEVYNEDHGCVASYSYDSWGNILSKSGTLADINPFRYRGYYYDNESWFYYLQSRYYDPAIGRFINADIPETLTADFENVVQYNFFAYSFNNPVNMSDEAGTWPSWAKKIVAAVAVVAVVAAVAAVTVATAGAGTAAAVIAAGAAKGATIGMASGAAIGAATGAVSHRVSTGSWNGASTAALNGMGDGALSGAVTGAITGAASSALKVGQAARAWDSSSKGGPWTNMSDHYKRHVLLEGKKSMTRDVITYTDDALALWNNSNGVGKLMSSGSLRLKGPGVGGFYSQSGLIRSFFYQ